LLQELLDEIERLKSAVANALSKANAKYADAAKELEAALMLPIGQAVERFKEKPKADEDISALAVPRALGASWGIRDGDFLVSMGIYVFRLDALREILDEIVPGVSATPHAGWPVGFSVVSQVLFYAVHRPVVRILMGEPEYGALDIDFLAEHITRFSLAALGRGPAIVVADAASPVTAARGEGVR
jgi:hypothetical protein